MTCTLHGRGMYVSAKYTGLWVSVVFCFSIQQRLHLRAISGKILMNLVSEDAGIPVYNMCHISPNQIYSNIIFQVEVTCATTFQHSEWNVTETVALLVSSWSDMCNNFPNCIWPGLDSIKGVHVLLRLSWISIIDAWKRNVQ